VRLAAAAAVACFAALPGRGQDFDASAYEKKPLEWKGYLELEPEDQFLRRSSTGYLLQFPGETRTSFERLSTAAELSGLLRQGPVRLDLTGHTSWMYDANGGAGVARLYEAYGSWQVGPRAALEVGKRALHWGKGYAWSPVAFLERPKDPTDPELSREGFVMAGGEVVQSFGGPLQTLSLTAIALPTVWSLNDDYGPSGHVNLAARLYALVLDTDIDLLYTAPGSHGQRVGADISRNLGANLEVHGEWALVTEASRAVLAAGTGLTRESRNYTSWLVGLRYLTERDLTVIAEYYRNGGGYTEAEMRRFFDLVRRLPTDPVAASLAANAAAQGYGRPNASRDYGYLRLSQKEPFDILYFTPAVTAIVNAGDGSFSVVPEVVYAGVDDLELRARLFVNRGGESTEFGEKPVAGRLELRLRYFF
jgi:hypothetical protein